MMYVGAGPESEISTSGECLATKKRRPRRFHCTRASALDVIVDSGGDPSPSSSSVGDAERQRRPRAMHVYAHLEVPVMPSR